MKTTVLKIKPTGFELTFKRGCEDIERADGTASGVCTPSRVTVVSMRQASKLAFDFISSRADTKVELRPLFGPVAS